MAQLDHVIDARAKEIVGGRAGKQHGRTPRKQPLLEIKLGVPTIRNHPESPCLCGSWGCSGATRYRPEFPAQGFESLDEARAWAAEFVDWYNVDHRHSGIRYVSPEQRHSGQDQAILAARHEVYTQAKARHPARWSGATRDCSLIDTVTLNPERDAVVKLVTGVQHTQLKAA